jgi:acetyl esterase/lipase
MSVSLMARDRGGKAARFLLLIYPVADARQETASMKAFPDTPCWNAKANKRMWELYLASGDAGLRAYASPLEAESLQDCRTLLRNGGVRLPADEGAALRAR